MNLIAQKGKAVVYSIAAESQISRPEDGHLLTIALESPGRQHLMRLEIDGMILEKKALYSTLCTTASESRQATIKPDITCRHHSESSYRARLPRTTLVTGAIGDVVQDGLWTSVALARRRRCLYPAPEF